MLMDSKQAGISVATLNKVITDHFIPATKKAAVSIAYFTKNAVEAQKQFHKNRK